MARKNVSLALLRIRVLNSIVPLARTLISVWPLATDVEPVVSALAVSFECRTQLTPCPFFLLGPSLLSGRNADAEGGNRERGQDNEQ